MKKPADPGRAFVMVDREYDKAEAGPTWLNDPRIARCVVEALRFGEANLRLYHLHAFVIMPNHVHLLIQPKAPLPKITRTIKTFTARQANRILGRSGTRFWQEESYDHWVRSGDEFRRIINYIERNPVAASLVKEV